MYTFFLCLRKTAKWPPDFFFFVFCLVLFFILYISEKKNIHLKNILEEKTRPKLTLGTFFFCYYLFVAVSFLPYFLSPKKGNKNSTWPNPGWFSFLISLFDSSLNNNTNTYTERKVKEKGKNLSLASPSFLFCSFPEQKDLGRNVSKSRTHTHGEHKCFGEKW